MSLCTWRELIQSKKQDCLLLVSFCLVGFLLQKLFYSEQSKHSTQEKLPITKKLRNDKKKIQWKNINVKKYSNKPPKKKKKKSIFLLKVIFVKNTVFGKTPSTISREYNI